MSTKCPAIAAAAAISGLTRCVRPPRPWRPSKLRLLVEAQRSPGSQNVRIHSEAHGAAGLAPIEACFLEDYVEAFFFRLRFHGLRAGNDHRADMRRDLVAGADAGGSAQVFNAASWCRSQ